MKRIGVAVTGWLSLTPDLNLVAADVRRLMTPNPKFEIRNPKSI